VDAARKDWAGKEGVIDIVETPAEHLPFPDQSFDNLACLATLDATYQNQAVTEFLRVTRPGARIYFTGKNDHYFADDQEAYLAEVGARGKNHPNFFTDTPRLIDLLRQQGHRVDAVYCFPRRGDFAAFNYVDNTGGRFYEYLLVITRGDRHADLPEFSDAYSKTFRELSGAHG
jgi:ubiquinone/menaquinone biosynthesis C-methylase UbiE